MTNKVCYEPKETKPKRIRAQDMIGSKYKPDRTAFIGYKVRSVLSDLKPISKLYLVNFTSVFQADNPGSYSVDSNLFVVEKWVNVKIYVDDDGC